MKKWLTSICLAVTLIAGFASAGAASNLSTFAEEEAARTLPNQH
ncbi:hypothetical protein ACFOU2_14305 [Bacillus songklensis]|uniref:Uncharacterized protein n=1 Tax=Bacillus songklensis TaxID=1069116 RepID=A0ABV8B5W1_9BACI